MILLHRIVRTRRTLKSLFPQKLIVRLISRCAKRMDQVVIYASLPLNYRDFLFNELYTVTRYLSTTVASHSPVRLMYEKKKKKNNQRYLLTVRRKVRKIPCKLSSSYIRYASTLISFIGFRS